MVDLAVRFSGQTLAGRPRSPPPTRRRLASPLLPGAASSSASPRRLHLLRRHCVVPVPGCLRLRLPLAQGAAVSASSTAVAVNVAEHRLRRPRSATVPPCRTKSRCICLFLPLALPPRPPRCAVAVAEQGLQGGRGESEENRFIRVLHKLYMLWHFSDDKSYNYSVLSFSPAGDVLCNLLFAVVLQRHCSHSAFESNMSNGLHKERKNTKRWLIGCDAGMSVLNITGVQRGASKATLDKAVQL
ncbi:uncharacterized protein [Oryza sativa Japonica Group]|uniref:uncharacterized protein isoform X2 n=1 Tax=Oryza sativa subsp. japonica TaxID=39947 RepID=UPI00339C3EAB